MNVQIPVKWLQELLALCGPEDHELRERVMVSITAMDEQAAAPVVLPEPDGVANLPYFSYDSDSGVEFHETEAEAIKACESALGYYREESPDGWPDEVESLKWGLVLGRSVQCDVQPIEDHPDFTETCDYQLKPYALLATATGLPAQAVYAIDPVQAAADAASVGHLSHLVDHQTVLLSRAMSVMKAVELTASPIDESDGDLDARIPYEAWSTFVEARAALLHAVAQSPVAAPQAQADARDAEQPRLTVRLTSFPESNGKRNWTAMFKRTEKFDGLIGNAGGITIARGECWNRVAYHAEEARFLLGERGTEPDIMAYGDDVHTPQEWSGEDADGVFAAIAAAKGE